MERCGVGLETRVACTKVARARIGHRSVLAATVGAIKRRVLFAALAALLVGAGAPAVSASAETVASWWGVTTGARPTDLRSLHDGYLVVEAENLGDMATSGQVTISDTLPEHLTAISAEGVEGLDRAGERGAVNCAVVSAGREVTCSYEATLPAYEQIEVLIGVAVGAGAQSGELNTATVTGGGAGTRTATHTIEVDGAERFGVESYTLTPEGVGGSLAVQAGSHPFQLTSVIAADSAPQAGTPRTVALAKDLAQELPPGLIADAAQFARCTNAQFATEPPSTETAGETTNDCPADAAVGVALVRFAGPGADVAYAVPIFNMTAGAGEFARFGFEAGGAVTMFLGASVRSGGDYGVTISAHEITQSDSLLSVKLTLWGVPGSGLHDGQRGWECLKGYGACPVSTAPIPPPLLSLPSSCEAPFQSTLLADSWPSTERASEQASFAYRLPRAIEGCNRLPFEPSLEVIPDIRDTSTASGLDVDVHVPQTVDENPAGLVESAVRNVTVALPEGVQINPSAGNGLEVCSEGLAGYEGEETFPGLPGTTLARFKPTIPGGIGAEATLEPGLDFCASASKVGTVAIRSPLFAHELEGDIYLASQNANPFGSLIAMYLVAEDPVSGTVVELPQEMSLCAGPGEVLDGVSCQAPGQIVMALQSTPQLPLEDAELRFFGGERALLAMPAHCAIYSAGAVFEPWSGEPQTSVSAPFPIEHGVNGGPCPGANLPFSPSLAIGVANINAGRYSPLTATIGRQDGEQSLAQATIHLPPGLSGVIASAKTCAEPQANEGTCAPESEIGAATMTAGVGGDPVTIAGGHVFLTGPYDGGGSCANGTPGCAPFGLSIALPAEIGPFDLEHDASNPGQNPACDCFVVRAKVEIDKETAALTITTNAQSEGHAIPHLIDGIPVQIKTFGIALDEHFTVNPTSCEKLQIAGSVTSDENAGESFSEPFQLANCSSLAFAPKLAASASAATAKANGASLAMTVSEPAGSLGTQANLERIKVALPEQLPARMATLQKACAYAQFAADPSGCPATSKIGSAVLRTPLLPVPLEGPAILVARGGETSPSVTTVLQGDGVQIDLVGMTAVAAKTDALSITYQKLPDIPLSTFELDLPAGPNSALIANANPCALTKVVKTVSKRVAVKRHGHVLRRHGHVVYRIEKIEQTARTSMTMPTELLAQSGAPPIGVSTPVTVAGCAKSKPASKAKKSQKKKHKAKRGRRH
jgi:hypothetical protein